MEDEQFTYFAAKTFQPFDELSWLLPLEENNSKNDTYFTFLDTEGLDYQTEAGENYDIISVLPHVLIAENVFLVVRDRLNPFEVGEIIEKIAKAAEATEGTLSFRNGKLFGHLTIIVNKCQGYF